MLLICTLVSGNLQPVMSYYRYHVFFCVNRREGGQPCCANHGSQEMRDHAKDRIKALGLAGQGGVRINQAGCMDRCHQGPVMVVYPEGTWYGGLTPENLERVIEDDLASGRAVEDLVIGRNPLPRILP